MARKPVIKYQEQVTSACVLPIRSDNKDLTISVVGYVSPLVNG
jgi:hypothetical protein